MKEFVEKLKAYLANSDQIKTRETQVRYCTTCWGYDSVETIDIDNLWEEIDAFCASFVKEEL